MYKNTAEGLERCYREQVLAAVNCAQLKAKIQLIHESLQDFVTAIEELAHQALDRLPQYYTQREASFELFNMIRDQEVKELFLMGTHRMLEENFSPALQFETTDELQESKSP